MESFYYKDREAYCEGVSLRSIADRFGTPVYVYSELALKQRCHDFQQAFSPGGALVCYAVKANSNLSLLRKIFAAGFGADVVSGGELQRALVAGVPPQKVVYSGVGKRRDEMIYAMQQNILSFNVEAPFELATLAELSRAHKETVSYCLRVNPNIDARTHPGISTGLLTSKFGLAEEDALALWQTYKEEPYLKLIGLACHIGSQIMDLDPMAKASQYMVDLARRFKKQGAALEYLDMGGGLGIPYRAEAAPSLKTYATTLYEAANQCQLKLIIEPGRALVGAGGVLLTAVLGRKENRERAFVIVDAGMNDLLRPSLYNAYHDILPVMEPRQTPTQTFDVVGPVCETADWLGRDRQLPLLQAGDLLYIKTCGAYGACMASQYNSRQRPGEVLVAGGDVKIIRQREKLEELWRQEL